MDTRNKRSSAINLTIPWRGMYPAPDGTVAQVDRQVVALMYAGISAGEAVDTAAGYYYGDTRRKPKRRKVIIDGLTYFVTPAEEAALLQKFIDSIERKAETLQKPEPKPTKRAAKKLKAVAKLPDELQQRLERLKIHQALIAEESAREAAHLKAVIAEIERRNRLVKAALLRQQDDEAIALILAVA